MVMTKSTQAWVAVGTRPSGPELSSTDQEQGSNSFFEKFEPAPPSEGYAVHAAADLAYAAIPFREA